MHMHNEEISSNLLDLYLKQPPGINTGTFVEENAHRQAIRYKQDFGSLKLQLMIFYTCNRLITMAIDSC